MDGKRIESIDPVFIRFCRLGGASAFLLLAYSVITMIVMAVLGGAPATAEEAFAVLRENKLIGLIRLDLLTVFAMMFYYLLYAGLCAALWKADPVRSLVAAALAFFGATLVLATPSAASLVHLGERYAAAATEAQKALYLAAGESVIASDMWHGTGAIVGGLLVPCAGVLVSAAMLRGQLFGKATAWIGILTNGLDLARMLVGFFAPGAAVPIMMVAGPLYLFWFTLIGRGLLRLGRQVRREIPAQRV